MDEGGRALGRRRDGGAARHRAEVGRDAPVAGRVEARLAPRRADHLPAVGEQPTDDRFADPGAGSGDEGQAARLAHQVGSKLMLLSSAPERSTSLLMKARVAAISSATGSMSVEVSLCTMAGSFIVACTMAFAFS